VYPALSIRTGIGTSVGPLDRKLRGSAVGWADARDPGLVGSRDAAGESMRMNFAATTRIEPDETVVVGFAGVLDLETIRSAEAALADAEAHRPKRIVVDLSEVEFIDSTGLRLIVSADARLRRDGRMLELVKGPDRVHRVFRMTLMNERLAFIDHAPGAPSASA